MLSPTDDPADAALLADLLHGLRDGEPQLAFLAGAMRRSLLALRLAQAADGPVVLVSGSLASIRLSAASGTSLSHRLLTVPGGLEPPELALRLREIATAVHRVIAIEVERLWQARMIRALAACRPRLMIVEAGALGVGPLESRLAVDTAVRRLCQVLPDAALVLLSQPLSDSGMQSMGRLAGATPRTIEPLIPHQVALRVVRLGRQRDLLPALLDAVVATRGAGLIVAPSRGKAAALAEALRRAGQDAAVYHGGLTPSERSALLGAVRAGKQRLLVATEAIGNAPDLPCPSLLAFSHPPRAPESLLRLAERAVDAASPTPLLLYCSARDLAVLADADTAGLPTLAKLRSVYGRLRRIAVQGQVLLDPEGRPTGLPAQWRLCLDLLARAGYLVRREDLARAATITRIAPDPAALPWLAGALALRRGVPAPVDPLALAVALHMQPHTLHERLLDDEERGLLTLRTVGRELLYSLVDAPPDAASRLTATVEAAASQANAAAHSMAGVLQSSLCRVQALAQACGWPLPPRCGRCDRCRPDHGERAGEQSDAVVILQALALLPRGLPRGAIQRTALHALAARGRRPAAADVARTIDALLARNLLEVREGELGGLLAVSAAGSSFLASATAGDAR